MSVYFQSGHSLMAAADCVQPLASFMSMNDNALPVPANDNAKLKADALTPSQALLAVARIKQRLLRENRATHSLLVSASRRKIWDELVACERGLRWKYFR
jgi:hypothetical protein